MKHEYGPPDGKTWEEMTEQELDEMAEQILNDIEAKADEILAES